MVIGIEVAGGVKIAEYEINSIVMDRVSWIRAEISGN